MFAHIAKGYDRFDHVASMGNDFVWRPRALWSFDRFRQGVPAPRRVLDVGCGTGDLTRLTARHYPGAEVTGLDVTAPMLRKAQLRGGGPTTRARWEWARGTALRLPFRTGAFDLVTSAFVVRNLPRLPDVLAELRRVTSPGGFLLTLEITEPQSARFRSLFHSYFDTFVPWLGSVVGSEGPYRYLPESLRALPDRHAMLGMMRAAGYGRVDAAPQSLGIVTTYLGRTDPSESGPGRTV